MDAAIHLKDVTKRYDGFTLDHITMDIPKGAIVGLVGENGAGKTTLLRSEEHTSELQSPDRPC